MEGSRRPVVVGIDGSEPSRGALRWAAGEAAARGLPLRVLFAASSADRELWATARAMVAEAVGEARGWQPTVTVDGGVTDGNPIAELCAASAGASVMVTAASGVGGFPGMLLGSIASQVALHAQSPAVIVRGVPEDAAAPVLVGVDNSRESDLALAAGFETAEARGVGVVAVRVCRPTMLEYRGERHHAKAGPATVTSAEHYAISEAVAEWRTKYPKVEVETRVVTDSPAGALVAASARAQLLVIGSRGHASFPGVRLGATALQVLHHAACPVMIVR